MREKLIGLTYVVAAALAAPSAARAGLCPTGWTCDCLVQTPSVPAGAGWGTANNRSFENGFTGGVGNGWAASYQIFSGVPTYADSTARATHGSHSQLVTIPQISYPYQSQKAGVYQQFYVVPGQSYTVTVNVYVTLDVGEAYNGEKMVAIVGLDPYGEVQVGAGSIQWSALEGVKNQWVTLSVTTTAYFEVMTVHVCGMHKWATPGTGRVWIDNVVITGPVPTTPPSPPEPGWIDPDSGIPATTGGERVANGSFEGSWSGGVAASWSSWSTAGTGYWRQSTRVGKIGAGKYDFGEADTIVAMNPKTALTMQMGDADYWATKPNMVDTVIVGRLYIDPLDQQYLTNPTHYGRVHADNCWIEQQAHPRIDCWQGFNEPDLNGRPAEIYAFEKAFAERCHELGMKAIVLNISVGSPGNMWKMLDARDLLAVADYVGYHSYGGPNDQLMVNAPAPIDEPCAYALRHRRYVDMYRDRGWRMPPVIYTEATTYGGWHGVFTPEQIRDDLLAFGGYMNEDRWCTGLTLFDAGGTGAWEAWNIRGQGDIAAACGTWNQNHPSEATDGLYSQQFGAGPIHPTTLSQMQNPNGAFTGGIKQQITGLTAGKTYLLDLDFRYEFRGLQPQVRFYAGVDLTGQTADPGAASIDWGADLIAAEPAVHEIFERTWRTFTATGPTASIWLKASQTVSNPAFRVSVDRVSVKQVQDGAVAPAIQVSPTLVNASTPVGGSPADGSFTVRNSGTGTLNYTISDNASWLSCSPASGTSTGEADTITIGYSTASLAAGTYNATITISDPAAGNSPQTVAVVLTITSTPPSTITESFNTMPSWTSSFDAPWGGPATWSIVAGGQSGNGLQTSRASTGSSARAQVYTIQANTDYTIAVYIQCPSAAAPYWAECAYKLGSFGAQDFDADPATWTLIQKFSDTGTNGNGNTWTQYAKTFNSGAGTQISVGFKLGNSGGTAPTVRWDTLTLTPAGAPPPAIGRSPATLAPSCGQGSNAAGQSFTVQNTGGGTLNYTIGDNASWLSCSPTSGTSTGESDTIAVTYATSGLTAGTYTAVITISDAAASNSPQTIGVTLTVNPPPPTIGRSPASLSPSCTQGTNAANQTFTVQNTGGGTLNYSITDNANWLSCSPTSGTSTGEPDTIGVTYATSSLTAGTYTATITLTDPAATNSPQTIGVTLVVNAPAGITGDFDGDGDVDLADFALFQLCFNGPNAPPGSNCSVDADFDNDADVDLADFSLFQLCFNGPNRPPAANCP